jgi:hypothetical protein
MDKRRGQYNNNNNSLSNSNDATALLKKAEQRLCIQIIYQAKKKK